MRMGEALENPGNLVLIEGAKQNLSCLTATFSQSVREEIQQPELGPGTLATHCGAKFDHLGLDLIVLCCKLPSRAMEWELILLFIPHSSEA